jgi:hypothetical protein
LALLRMSRENQTLLRVKMLNRCVYSPTDIDVVNFRKQVSFLSVTNVLRSAFLYSAVITVIYL